MAINELFSERQKRERGEVSDIYVYDQLPEKVRVYIIHIIRKYIAHTERHFDWNADSVYEVLTKKLCEDLGILQLNSSSLTMRDQFEDHFLGEKSIEDALDIVQICFQFIEKTKNIRPRVQSSQYKETSSTAIEDLNIRLRQHGIGYRFESGIIVRVDSEYMHSGAVLPTLDLLRDPEFKGANQEFLSAHEHYRHGRYEAAIVECGKAFESTMKIIANIRQWKSDRNPKYKDINDLQAKELVDITFDNKLIPDYLQDHFSSLRQLLCGASSTRNKQGGHGRGPQQRDVPGYLARYALNLAATNILFLYDAHQSSLQKAP